MHQAYPLTVVPPRDRFEYFSSVVDEVFCPMHCAPGGSADRFVATLDASELGGMRLARISTSPVAVSRRPGVVDVKSSKSLEFSQLKFSVQFACYSRARHAWVVDEETWEYHRRRGDFSRWLRESVRNERAAAAGSPEIRPEEPSSTGVPLSPDSSGVGRPRGTCRAHSPPTSFAATPYTADGPDRTGPKARHSGAGSGPTDSGRSRRAGCRLRRRSFVLGSDQRGALPPRRRG